MIWISGVVLGAVVLLLSELQDVKKKVNDIHDKLHGVRDTNFDIEI